MNGIPERLQELDALPKSELEKIVKKHWPAYRTESSSRVAMVYDALCAEFPEDRVNEHLDTLNPYPTVPACLIR